MSDTNPSSGRKVLQYIAGFIPGAVMGLLILAAVLTLLVPFYPGEQGLSLVGFAIIGFLPCILIGGAMGVLFIRQLRRATRPRRFAGIGALLYIMTIAAGIAIVVVLLPYIEEKENIWTARKVRTSVERTFATGQKSWQEVYVNRYPYTEASLPKILGPLHYPDARLVSWDDVPGKVSGWDILTITDDHPDQVLAFYASVLPGGIEGYPSAFLIDRSYAWSTHSTILPSIDDVEARVILEGDSTGMHIRYMLYSPIIIVPEESTPWSEEERAAYLEDARKKQREPLDAIASENAGWIYPGATYTWGSLGGRKQLAYETSDSLDQVVAYYESVKGEAQLSNGQYRFRPNNNGWNPEFTVYPVGDKVRIHFRYLQ